MKRFDLVAMFASLWLLASMVIDAATPKELILYDRSSVSPNDRHLDRAVVVASPTFGFFGCLRHALDGFCDGARNNHAEADVPAHGSHSSRTVADRRHRDQFSAVATFKGQCNISIERKRVMRVRPSYDACSAAA